MRVTRDADGTIRYPSNHINSHFRQSLRLHRNPRAVLKTTRLVCGGVDDRAIPTTAGSTPFFIPQEFDIFEDFFKPKRENDISHHYHCSVNLGIIKNDAGDATGIGEGGIIDTVKLSRTSSGCTALMEQYDGWHTVGLHWTPLEHIFYVDGQETLRQTYRDVPVTNVPQRIWISCGSPTPNPNVKITCHGRLEEAEFPDQLVVDYVRVYDEDTGDRQPPQVKLAVRSPSPFKEGEPVTFEVTATASKGKLVKLLLFSMGRIRAEQPVDSAKAQTTFTVGNLFPLVTNTVIAMAQDEDGLVGQSEILALELMAGREYTGTAWQGKPQKIPGTVQGGCYDEGGNGVAYRSASMGPSDLRLEYRKSELGALPEAVEVGADYSKWITYEVEVAETGEYEAELFMNRPTYSSKRDMGTRPKDETIRMNLGETGSAGATLLKWNLSTTWDSGGGWRAPQMSLGKQKVRLPAGRHKLVMLFDDVSVRFTFFCKLVFRPANG